MENTIKILILLAAMIFWNGCSSKSEPEPPAEKILVKTAKVTQQDVHIPIHTSGKLALKTEMKLSFKTGGIVRYIFVDEGDIIEKGTLLAKLDVSEIEAQTEQARSGYEKAVRDHERAQKLYADSVATYEQLQNANTALNVAHSQLKIADFNLRHSAITAPSKGKILRRLAETNELAGPGMPIFLFGSLEGNWIVRVGITDREMLRLRLDDPAQVWFDAYAGKTFEAYVSQISGAANPMTGTFDAELTIDEDGHKLLSGFVARVDITPSQSSPFFIIPIESLVEADGDRGFVYALDLTDDSVRRLPVKIGHLLDQGVAITTGLEDVNEVITEGASYLSEKSQVELVDSLQ